MKIKIHKKPLYIKDIKVCRGFEKFFGLMFVSRKKAKVLLFNFLKPTKTAIHSFFVFFPFVAIWLDDKNKILEKRIVKPWTFLVLPKKKFNRLVEIPMNKKYRKVVGLLCSS